MANYKDLSKYFFNTATGEDHRAWADAAAAYFNSLSGKDKSNFAEAMAAYYGTVNASTQTIVVNGETLTGVAPTGTYTNTVTFTVANGVITAIALS